MSSAKRALANAALLAASFLVGVAMCEAAARFLLNPADFLSVRTVRDEVLGIRIEPGTPGFDELGFRNAAVPAAVDVLAVGDSHTYGNNAKMSESWPAVVGALAGLEVYNLGMGGYGPNQYYELLKRHISRLRPRWVVCAIYLGDDFENAFLMTYGREYWSFLRKGDWTEADANIWQIGTEGPWHQQVRAWLSSHSLVYRLTVHGPLVGRLKRSLQIEHGSRAQMVTSVTVEDAGIQEAFRPEALRSRLDQRSPTVREGMRITFELLERMKELAVEHGSRLAVVIIPTKETVFADYLLRSPDVTARDTIEQLIRDERTATVELVALLDRIGVPEVQPLPGLSRRVSEQLYSFSDQDMHPNRNGYRVIGETVAEFLAQDAPHADRRSPERSTR